MNSNSTLGFEYDSCASHSTCEECVGASSLCHFCEKDYKCHAVGSIKGCAIGMTCHRIDECARHEPEHIGYGPTPSVVVAVLCLVLTLLLCCCACSWIRLLLKRRPKPRKHYRLSARRRSSRLPSTELEQREALLSSSDEEGAEGAAFEDVVYVREPALDDRSPSAVANCVRRSLFLIGFAVFTVAALMYYPRIPDYNICNRKFDWVSILKSLTSVTPKVQYEVLLSISNENRFGFELDYAVAKIHHRNISVGSWHLNVSDPFIAEAGSISDLLLTLHIAPGFSEGIVLWKDFLQGTLVFSIDADVTGYIKWGSMKLYRLSTSVRGIEFPVDVETPRNLCNCPDYEAFR